MKRYFGLMLLLCSLYSCKEEHNDDIVQHPDKNQAIETVLSVSHHDGFDLLTTTHKIWVKGQLNKILVTTDTLPALGTKMVTAKDNNGVERMEPVREDYEFYITVQ